MPTQRAFTPWQELRAVYGDTKPCSRCGEVRLIEQFYIRKESKRRIGPWLTSQCKPCNLEQAKEYMVRKRDFIQRYKLERGCADCGYNKHPAALDFDHSALADSKLFDPGGGLRGVGMNRLRAEIAKCEVVCANCHRVREDNKRKEAANAS